MSNSRLKSRLIDDVRINTAASLYKVMVLGDSIALGGGQTGWRREFFRRMRLTRSNVRSCGSVSQGWSPIENRTSEYPSDWLCEGHSGYTIEQITSGIGGWLATAGELPDIVCEQSGTNNLSTADTYSDMLTKKATQLAAYKAAMPNARIFVSTIPTVGPSQGGSYATLQTKAAAFNAGLAAVVSAAGPQFQFVDIGGKLSVGDLSSDGVHPLGTVPEGAAKLGRMWFDAADPYIPRAGMPFPRSFRKRPSRAHVSLSNVQYVSITNAALAPTNASNWYAALEFYPTALAAGPVQVMGYGTTYADGFLLATGGSTLWWYTSAGNVFNGFELKLTINTWNKIVVHYDATKNITSFWLNGTKRKELAGGLGTITAGKEFVVGKNPGIGVNGVPGLYGSLEIGKGSAVPGLLDVRDHIENHYLDHNTIPGLTAGYAFDEGSGTSFASYSQLALTAGTTGGCSWSAAGAVVEDWAET